jgi:formate dehydrogenase major subunit
MLRLGYNNFITQHMGEHYQRRAVMGVSRRDFLKITGGTLLLGSLEGAVSPEDAQSQELRIKDARITTTVCPYCSVGCGILVYTKDGKVINCEGDPEHPISEGSLCSKGATLYQMVNNQNRLLKPLYRSPGTAEWKEVEWDWALDQIARRIKDTRDSTFKVITRSKIKEKKIADTPDESGLFPEIMMDVEREFTVNRTDGIAHVGSAALDNEECYLMQKLMRSWGLVYIEHQARL